VRGRAWICIRVLFVFWSCGFVGGSFFDLLSGSWAWHVCVGG
jgi:hypothetical protein